MRLWTCRHHLHFSSAGVCNDMAKNMRERLARILCVQDVRRSTRSECDRHPNALRDWTDENWQYYAVDSDAVLAAMEAPTTEMVDAAPCIVGENPGPSEVWSAMIKEARKP